jgi:hypothetical protein
MFVGLLGRLLTRARISGKGIKYVLPLKLGLE